MVQPIIRSLAINLLPPLLKKVGEWAVSSLDDDSQEQQEPKRRGVRAKTRGDEAEQIALVRELRNTEAERLALPREINQKEDELVGFFRQVRENENELVGLFRQVRADEQERLELLRDISAKWDLFTDIFRAVHARLEDIEQRRESFHETLRVMGQGEYWIDSIGDDHAIVSTGGLLGMFKTRLYITIDQNGNVVEQEL